MVDCVCVFVLFVCLFVCLLGGFVVDCVCAVVVFVCLFVGWFCG